LMSDMAHISGLVAAQETSNPFDYSDVVTTTTHKSLRGPRGAMIFYRKGVRKVTKKGKEVMFDLDQKINFSVFPGHQGGPHNHTIAGLAVALKQAAEPAFKDYQIQVKQNAKALCDTMQELGYTVVTGGTDLHLLLVDLRPLGLDGSRVERVLELAHIALNKNTVPGDKSALVPSGIRLGTPALTSRGFMEADFQQVAKFLDQGVKITAKLKAEAPGKKLSDFNGYVTKDMPEIAQLRSEVEAFAGEFPAIGFDVGTMRYP